MINREQLRDLPRELLDIIDAAFNLSLFAKTHEYPEFGTRDFMELTGLYDKLETTFRRAELYPKGRIGD